MNSAALHPVAQQLIASLHTLAGQGLLSGMRYSASVRDGDLIWLTPAEVRPDVVQPHQLILRWPEGQLLADEPLRPCTTWPLHARLYEACPEIGAIMITHPAEVLAAAPQENKPRQGIASIPFLPHDASFDEIASALQKHPTVLCAEHGLLVCGLTLSDALNHLDESLLQARIANRSK